MLKLPKIPYNMEKNKQQTVSMGNINYSKMTRDGDIADSSGISGRHFPYITTAKECSSAIGEMKNCRSATLFNEKWAQVDASGALYYDGQLVGQLKPGEKQFAAINTKLVIMPDKKYLDISGEAPELKDMEATVALDAAFDKNYILNLRSEYSILGYANGKTFTAAMPENGLDCMGDDYRLLIHGTIIRALKFMCSFTVKECVTTNDMRYYRVYVSENQCNVLEELRTLLGSGGRASVVAEIANRDNYGIVDKYSWQVLWDKEANGKEIDKYYSPGYYRLCDTGDVRSLPQVEGEFEMNLFVWLPGENYHAVSTNGGPNCRLVIPDEEVDCLIRLTRYSYEIGNDTYEEMKLESQIGLPKGIFEGKIYNGADNEVDFTEILKDCNKIIYSFSDVNSATYSAEVDIRGVKNNSFQTQEDIVDALGHGRYGYMNIKVYRDKAIQVFKKGDAVTVSGSSEEKNNITFVIDSISSDGSQIFAKSEVFEALATSERITIERRVPDLDYICEHDNRLYGCSIADNTIYASALGDPTNIYAYTGISTDSYAVAVASEGPFTGCCPYDGGVMFWKSDKLHKLLGSYPAEYALYTYNIDGVQTGSHRSLQNINEVLFYKGDRGVFSFDGSPHLISQNFGDKRFSCAVGGNDGERYYVSMIDEDSKAHLFSYNTRTGLWVREGGREVSGFVRSGNDAYILEGGEIKLYEAKETPSDAEWYVQFTPIYETIEGHKSYSRIKLRAEIPKGSYMVVSVRCDGGRWAECGKIVGKREGIVPVMVPVNRCDKFELKIGGKGPCTVHSILREFYVGGDR